MSLKPNFNPRSKERPKTMKTITISILLALTACTTIIVEPPNDAGPTLDSFMSMDGSMPDSFVEGDTLAAPDDVGTRYDVGNDATPRDIDDPIVVCDDHFNPISGVEACTMWAGMLSWKTDFCEAEVRVCPWESHRSCSRCDRDAVRVCIQELSRRLSRGPTTSDETICGNVSELLLAERCSYLDCGWFTS